MTPARSEEERVAFDNLVTERLNATHPDTPSEFWPPKARRAAGNV